MSYAEKLAKQLEQAPSREQSFMSKLYERESYNWKREANEKRSIR